MRERIKNKKGFTLVELLAVIVILGLLMAIAIPSVTRYIVNSRKKTLVKTIDSYITAVVNQVNDGEYKFSDSSKIFAIPIECIALEKGGSNPFGNWMQANSSYWAYVLVQYDSENYNYNYGFTFKDDAGYGMYPTVSSNILENGSQIRTGLDDLQKLETRHALDYLEQDKWDDFNVSSSTRVIVLESASEGMNGDGKSSCTLCQKGDNYDLVEQEKKDKWKIGREICFEEECFNIISSDSNTVTMLAREKIDLTTSNPKQNANAGSIKLSNPAYWLENGTLNPKYGTGFPAFVYDENSNTYPYIEAYELYLKSLGIESVVASMISDTQIKNINNDNSSHENSWLKKDYLWITGSLQTSDYLWYYRSDGYVYGNRHFTGGIRPIITVDKIEIEFN